MTGRMLAVLKAKEVERLLGLGLSDRKIARALKINRRTVQKYREQIGQEAAAVPESPAASEPAGWADLLDWKEIEAEVVRGVTLLVLWEEHSEAGRVPVQYPAFWKQFSKRCPAAATAATMVRVFAPGQRAEIDYADGIEIIDPITHEITKTQFFAGVLCHSRYAYAEFSLSQKTEDFLASQVRMLEWFGGVPESLAPDNLKSAVAKVHRYDPVINLAYTRFAEHYELAVLPARVRSPRDKAIIERTIQIFQRWFFMKVRKRTFTSLAELNRCLREHLVTFNDRRHRIFGRSRREMFEDERSSLKALPAQAYEVSVYHTATLHPDCHLSFDANFYSAPHLLRGRQLDIWATHNVVEIYYNGERVALHGRRHTHGKFITAKEHYPPAQQAYAEATPCLLRSKAAKLGFEISKLIHQLLSGATPLQYIRRCQGIIRLAEKYGGPRVNKAIELAGINPKLTCQSLENRIKLDTFWENRAEASRPIVRGTNEHLRGEGLLN
jgi:transposase